MPILCLGLDFLANSRSPTAAFAAWRLVQAHDCYPEAVAFENVPSRKVLKPLDEE